MPGLTVPWGLPFPTASDQPLVHLDIKALADKTALELSNVAVMAEWEYNGMLGPTGAAAEAVPTYAGRPRATGVTATAAGAANTTVTITRAGLYRAGAGFRLDAGGAGLRAISIEHLTPGAVRIRRASNATTTTDTAILSVSETFRCAVGDMLRPIVFTAVALGVSNAFAENNFAGEWVGI